MGSGKLIKRAIKKHGISNFSKEILYIFDSETAMNAKEAELVVVSEQTYNICPGGMGGWGYVNDNRLWLTEAHRNAAKSNIKIAIIFFMLKIKTDESFKRKYIKNGKEMFKKRFGENNAPWVGLKHTEENKKKMSEIKIGHGLGKTNSQFGTCWITNGFVNKKIKREDLDIWLVDGYRQGRI